MRINETIQIILIIFGVFLIALPVFLMYYISPDILMLLSWQVIGIIIFVCGMRIDGGL